MGILDFVSRTTKKPESETEEGAAATEQVKRATPRREWSTPGQKRPVDEPTTEGTSPVVDATPEDEPLAPSSSVPEETEEVVVENTIAVDDATLDEYAPSWSEPVPEVAPEALAPILEATLEAAVASAAEEAVVDVPPADESHDTLPPVVEAVEEVLEADIVSGSLADKPKVLDVEEAASDAQLPAVAPSTETGHGNVATTSGRSAEMAAQFGQSESDGRAELGTAARVTFSGRVITVVGGALKIPTESRNLCALFDTGLWLVSSSHRNSPLVTSVAAQARRQGFKVNDATFVTPDVIQQAYLYNERQAQSTRLDENSIRRRIVEVLTKARDVGANDIHIEASGGRTKIEFRIEGALRLWETWTQKEGELFLSAVWSHASVQSGVTANWLEPQAAMIAPGTGPDSITFPEGVTGVRCQWIPLADGGRYLDMRLHYDSVHILGEGQAESDVDMLGFSPEQTALIRHLRKVPGGMRVIAAPVNQGKTTTLRVMLNRRMVETNLQLNCLLIEDPPEGGVISSRQVGISAAHKDEQREKTFTEIMRSALRLDPDIVMLGETRDLTTATFLFRLALTGRQVYTTLHVYAALAIPQRLRDLGIEPYLAYDHNLVRGMISQRLTRMLCPHCRVPLREAARQSAAVEQISHRVRAALSQLDFEHARRSTIGLAEPEYTEPDLSEVYLANPEGCPHCYRGRLGRTVVAEVIETDARLMALLQDNRMGEAKDYWLSGQGLAGTTMMMHALDKIRKGILAPEDAEMELGPLASDREVAEFEQRMGTDITW